jgi:hypothetical protein
VKAAPTVAVTLVIIQLRNALFNSSYLINKFSKFTAHFTLLSPPKEIVAPWTHYWPLHSTNIECRTTSTPKCKSLAARAVNVLSSLLVEQSALFQHEAKQFIPHQPLQHVKKQQNSSSWSFCAVLGLLPMLLQQLHYVIQLKRSQSNTDSTLAMCSIESKENNHTENNHIICIVCWLE